LAVAKPSVGNFQDTQEVPRTKVERAALGAERAIAKRPSRRKRAIGGETAGGRRSVSGRRGRATALGMTPRSVGRSRCRTRTVENVLQAFVLEGFEAARFQATGASQRRSARRCGPSQRYRPAPGESTARRLRPLDAAVAGRSSGETGDRGIDQSGADPSDAKKKRNDAEENRVTGIPPDADARSSQKWRRRRCLENL